MGFTSLAHDYAEHFINSNLNKILMPDPNNKLMIMTPLNLALVDK